MEAIERLPVELINRGSVARIGMDVGMNERAPTRRAKLEKQR
jgi:hypothetical protein